MRIGLINENSQANKNKIVLEELTKVANYYHHEVINFGMTDIDDKSLTYVEEGLLAAILLNTKVVDFIVTGCGTGEGAMLALNSFPNVFCGLVTEPLDAYLFSQINDGNAISIPFAKGFGWGSEITLYNIFEQLLKQEFGGGYPIERREPEQRNKKILDNVKKITCKSMIEILKEIDKDLLMNVIERPTFKENFEKYAENGEIKKYILQLLEK